MSEATPDTPADAPAQEPPKQLADEQTPTTPATPPTVEELQAKVDELTKESRKWEGRAKENGTKAKELDQQRKAAMTDAERAVSEAEERGRTAATTEFGKELAQTQFDALAGRRNPGFDTAKALKRLDLSSLLDENGRPNAKEIEAAVDDLVPAAADAPPTFDGGARTPPPAQQGMTGLIRKAAGRA